MNSGEWNGADPVAWSKALGLIHVPLFSAEISKLQPGSHAVLLDGQMASFALSVSEDPRELEDKPTSWAWSADVNHAIVIDSKRAELFVRRWDYPSVRRFKLPAKAEQTHEIMSIFRKDGLPKRSDVVVHVLRAFRQVRVALKDDAPGDSVLVFTALLVAAERVQERKVDSAELRACRTVEGVFKLLEQSGGIDTEFGGLRRDVQITALGDLVTHFLEPVPLTGCVLNPSLLLRHAAGRLFQEANLILEREPVQQLHFSGMAPEKEPAGMLGRDVRFTPPALARALTEQSLTASNSEQPGADVITFFDPACGSGIFLVEAFREWQGRGASAKVRLVGFDISEVSCRITRFCLQRAIQEADLPPKSATVDVQSRDALENDWPKFDVLLMNPPFVPWNRMDRQERGTIETVLGDLNEGHSDKAMAFVWKAVTTLREGNAIGTIVPAPLLESRAALKWREALHNIADLRLLGKFEGFQYFVASLVEPAFFVLSTKDRGADVSLLQTTVVVAGTGFEDESLRALRLDVSAVEGGADWDVYTDSQSMFAPSNWMPRRRQQLMLREQLLSRGLTTIGQLFDVHQGIRAGHKCFSISADAYHELPAKERKLFRPAATNATIREARLFKDEFIFYPYSEGGATIETEEQLYAVAKVFAKTHLAPVKPELEKRSGINPERWWLLTRERSWQHRQLPKLVSSYFGASGRFAFDRSGMFVVHQGQAWLWKQRSPDHASDEDANAWFVHTKLPFAYVAILNSGWFERLLGLWCPRVSGGQFDLSNRFVDKIPMPDLSGDSVIGDTIDLLASQGRGLTEGKDIALSELNSMAARAYGCSELLAQT